MTWARRVWPALLIVVAGLWAHGPALHGGWVWDDTLEVTQNPVLRDPAGLARIWMGPVGSDYFPLKSTVLWFEWHLWGEAPAGYHAVSIALHLLGALLFWQLLAKLGVRLAWAGGLLFAIHPLAVESVAWASELKNTLSLPLLLLSLILFLEFDQKGSGPEFRNSRGLRNSGPDPFYWLSLLCFLAALLSKTSVVMAPAMLLLHAWWRRGRLGRRDLLLAAPFLALSLALGLVTVHFQSRLALGQWTIPWGGLGSRLAVAGLNLGFYLRLCLWPAGLLPIYPQWSVTPPALVQFLPWVLVLALGGWLGTRRTAWSRAALLGLGCFVLNLLPVLGFVPMSYFHIAWAADHLAYLPLLGVIGLAAAGLDLVRSRLAVGVGLAVMTVFLASQSRRYAESFRDDGTLWSRTLEGNPTAWLAHNNLANFLAARGEREAAMGHFAEALRLKPDYPEAHYNWGLALALAGRLPEAVVHFEAAVRLRPDSAVMQEKLGNARVNMGRPEEALVPYRKALELDPRSAEAEANLGVALVQLGRIPEAIGAMEAALRIDPGYVAGYVNLGNALSRVGRTGAAIEQYQAAQRLGAADPNLDFNLATALLQAGRKTEAISQYEAVLQLRPGDDETRKLLAELRAAP
jgi:tetratricopeptide (TPR) repeat protein